jgi:hypothetical protein
VVSMSLTDSTSTTTLMSKRLGKYVRTCYLLPRQAVRHSHI